MEFRRVLFRSFSCFRPVRGTVEQAAVSRHVTTTGSNFLFINSIFLLTAFYFLLKQVRFPFLPLQETFDVLLMGNQHQDTNTNAEKHHRPYWFLDHKKDRKSTRLNSSHKC